MNKISPAYTFTKGIKIDAKLDSIREQVKLPQSRVYDYEARFHDESFADENRELIIPHFNSAA